MRVPGPLGHGAQPGSVHAQPVGRALDVERIAHRVGRGGRHRGARVAELQQQQRAQRTTCAGADGALHHVVGVLRLVLHGLAQVSEQRAGKEVGPLGEARHAVVVDEGGGLGPALQGLERVGALVELALRVRVAVERALAGAQPQPPGRAVRVPARLHRGQRRVGLQREGGGHGCQAVAPAQVGVRAIGQGQPGGHGQPVQADLPAGGAVRAGLLAQQPQVAGQQHGGLRRQHGTALGGDALDPLRARLARVRIARVLHHDHQRVRVVHHRAVLAACRVQHVGQDHVQPGGKAVRLVALEFRAQRGPARVAHRHGQQRGSRERTGTHQRGVEVKARSQQVPRAFAGVGRHLGGHGVHGAVTHQVEHRQVPCQSRRQALSRGGVEVEHRGRRHRGQVGHRGLPGQPLDRIGPQVGGTITVREQAHGPHDSGLGALGDVCMRAAGSRL